MPFIFQWSAIHISVVDLVERLLQCRDVDASRRANVRKYLISLLVWQVSNSLLWSLLSRGVFS